MKNRILFIVSLWAALLSMPGVIYAETLVMVPGFQARGMDWRFSQVSTALEARGWVDGGHYVIQKGVIRKDPVTVSRSKKVFYTLDLPTEENIQHQARILDQYLRAIFRDRNEPLSLVGHSAGGVVARHWLVTANQVPVKTLITIASPHLGTPLAELSNILSNSQEIVNLAEALGFTGLPKARGLFSDLSEARPGTYLYWLNRQAHPAIRYVSIVRNGNTPESADIVVPVPSQDMNNIHALRGKSERRETDNGHFLGVEDGYLLAWVMEQMKL